MSIDKLSGAIDDLEVAVKVATTLRTDLTDTLIWIIEKSQSARVDPDEAKLLEALHEIVEVGIAELSKLAGS